MNGCRITIFRMNEDMLGLMMNNNKLSYIFGLAKKFVWVFPYAGMEMDVYIYIYLFIYI